MDHSLNKLRIKVYADGAEKSGMLEMYANPLIAGFTTNPTLMKKAGVKNYEAFAREILAIIHDRPISFEVFSDEFDAMHRQAKIIASWGANVYVKIPIMNTKGSSSVDLIRKLTSEGVNINVTAMMTKKQVDSVLPILKDGPGAYVSVFAGRVADSGRDPVPMMKEIVESLRPYKNIELIWASPRELFNLIQADQIGCHIISMTNDLLKKIPLIGKDLHEFSLDTVRMFYNDAQEAEYTIRT